MGCVGCEKLQRDFVARTFVLIHQFSMFCTNFHALTKRSQMHPNTTKCTETLVSGPMGWMGCVGCEKLQNDFVARTFALIPPVQYVLQQVSCSYKMIPNAPKDNETDRIISLGSNGVDLVRSSRKSRRHFVARTFADRKSVV